MFEVFALITAPDWAQLNSTSSEIFRILRLAKNSLICRNFQLGSVGRNRKPDHIASGAVIRLTTEPTGESGSVVVSCVQLCRVLSQSGAVIEALHLCATNFGHGEQCNIHYTDSSVSWMHLWIRLLLRLAMRRYRFDMYIVSERLKPGFDLWRMNWEGQQHRKN